MGTPDHGWVQVLVVVVVRVVLDRVWQPGQLSLPLQLDGTRTHDRWAGDGGSGPVGLQGQGNVAGGVLRGRGLGGVRLIVLWAGLGFHVRAPA